MRDEWHANDAVLTATERDRVHFLTRGPDTAGVSLQVEHGTGVTKDVCRVAVWVTVGVEMSAGFQTITRTIWHGMHMKTVL